MEPHCYMCKQRKPKSEFNADKTRPSKLSSKCKSCETIYHKQESYKESNARWRERNPEKARAHRLVNNHKLRGDKCEECGVTEKLHGHHPDYSKPLEIVTLCDSCHKAEHRRLKNA